MSSGFEFEVLDSSELARRLKVRESWAIDQSKRSRTSDPIPVFRLGEHRRDRGGSPEMSDWLARRADHTTTRKAGPSKSQRRVLMAQQGSLYAENGSWFVRYWEIVRQPDGSLKRKHPAHR